MKLLCAIPRCPNKAPGVILLRGVRGGRRAFVRNVCEKCIAKIRKKYGVE